MDRDGVNHASVHQVSDGPKGGHGGALPTGTRLSEFELERVLGEGGFSFVYLAFDHTLERHVAIKEYLPSAYAMRCDDGTVAPRSGDRQATFETGLRSFIDEARLLAKFEREGQARSTRDGIWWRTTPKSVAQPLLQTTPPPEAESTLTSPATTKRIG